MTPEHLAHLSNLTPALAEAFTRHCQGMSQAEIAADLGLTAVTVRKRLSRAGILLRKQVRSWEVDAWLDQLEEAAGLTPKNM